MRPLPVENPTEATKADLNDDSIFVSGKKQKLL
jgi:hypothetical protein